MFSTVKDKPEPTVATDALPPAGRGWRLFPRTELIGIQGDTIQLLLTRQFPGSANEPAREEAAKIEAEFRETPEFKRVAALQRLLGGIDATANQTQAAIDAAKKDHAAALEAFVSAGLDDGHDVDGVDVTPLGLLPLDVRALSAKLELSDQERETVNAKLRFHWRKAHLKLCDMIAARRSELGDAHHRLEVEAKEKLNQAIETILAPVSDAAMRFFALKSETGDEFKTAILNQPPPDGPIGDVSFSLEQPTATLPIHRGAALASSGVPFMGATRVDRW